MITKKQGSNPSSYYLPFDFFRIFRYMYKTRFCFRLCSWQEMSGFEKEDFNGNASKKGEFYGRKQYS
jgi:hypothetical protein